MIKGRDLVSGLPKQEKIPIQIVEEKAHSQVRDICVQVKAVLESITPELASDIMNQGIYVSGGGAAFPKTAEWIKEEFKIPVHGVCPQRSRMHGHDCSSRRTIKA